jgi:glutamine synthetase
MRKDYDEVSRALEKLKVKHNKHIEVYGADNKLRMTGLHETSKIMEFSYGVSNRGASVRIPWHVASWKGTEAYRGYLEDRRPAANCDPYEVIERILRTVVMEE